MPYQNQWPYVRRTPVLPKYSRTAGVTVAMLTDEARAERVWTFRPTNHVVLVYLGESLEGIDAQIDNGPLMSDLPAAGAIWSAPALDRKSVV